LEEKFEDIKGVIRSHKLKKDNEYNGQKNKDKQRTTKHYTETKDPATRKSKYYK